MPTTIAFNREELQALRERAKNCRDAGANEPWARAFMDLYDALDRLDAMKSRSEIKNN